MGASLGETRESDAHRAFKVRVASTTCPAATTRPHVTCEMPTGPGKAWRLLVRAVWLQPSWCHGVTRENRDAGLDAELIEVGEDFNVALDHARQLAEASATC